MSFPLSIFLYIFYVFLAGWSALSLVGIYHMFKFGFKTSATFFATFIYVAVCFVILSVSFNLLNRVDWQSEVSVFKGIMSGNKYIERDLNL